MLTDKHCIAGLTRPCLDISIAEISKQKPHWHCGKLRGWFKYLILWYQQISYWYMSVWDNNSERSVMISTEKRSSKHAVEQYVGQWYWSIRYQLMVLEIRGPALNRIGWKSGQFLMLWPWQWVGSNQYGIHTDIQNFRREDRVWGLHSTCKTHWRCFF